METIIFQSKQIIGKYWGEIFILQPQNKNSKKTLSNLN